MKVTQNGQIIIEKAKGSNKNQYKLRSLRGVISAKINGRKITTEQIMTLTR